MSIAATSFREFFQPLTSASSRSTADLRVSLLDTPAERLRSTRSHVLRYAVHVVMGTVLFLAMILPVVLLNGLTTYLLANYQVSTGLISGLRVVQFVVVTLDLLLFAQLVLRATVDLLRRA